jgi:hypothetical protein
MAAIVVATTNAIVATIASRAFMRFMRPPLCPWI